MQNMKELFRVSMLIEGPTLGKLKLPKIKIPAEIQAEVLEVIQVGSKVLQEYLQELLKPEDTQKNPQ